MELIRTPAAARSFTSLIDFCFSAETKSDNFSMDVFIASAVKTIPIAIRTATHSEIEILKAIPAIITDRAAAECIQALCSLENRTLMPLKANLKLLSLSPILNLLLFMTTAHKATLNSSFNGEQKQKKEEFNRNLTPPAIMILFLPLS
jgi:hypothetical protein